VGTLKNKSEVAAEFLQHRNKEPGISIDGFVKDKALLSYVPEKNRAVRHISSMKAANWKLLLCILPLRLVPIFHIRNVPVI
jgi:hypothetical protein